MSDPAQASPPAAAAPTAPMIAFASDYGHADPFVGVCHLVLAQHAPQARVIDLVHDLDAHQVVPAAVALADAARWLPQGAVLLAVVDPGVGSARRGVALQAGLAGAAAPRAWLVGPDNGVLVPAAEALGGVRAAWALPGWEPPPGQAATFDGRDVFAPAAAHLAAHGHAPTAAEPLDPAVLVTPEIPPAAVERGRIAAAIVRVDRFGNLALAAEGAALAAAGFAEGDRVLVTVTGAAAQPEAAGAAAQPEPAGAAAGAPQQPTGARPARVAASFAALEGGLGVLPDAFGRLQIALDRGSAAAALAAGPGHGVIITTGA